MSSKSRYDVHPIHGGLVVINCGRRPCDLLIGACQKSWDGVFMLRFDFHACIYITPSQIDAKGVLDS